MHQEIQAIRFDVEDIGKHVKSSKKRFSWTFGLNGRNHTMILDFSFISGKVKLVVDRKTMLESELPANTSFQHPFTLDGYAINILQQGESFELRINNKVFSHLYNQAKTNTQFKNYEDQIKDIKVNQSSFQSTQKTVKLNIGALDGAKKKTRNTAETENWGNFGGNEMGIPSYFGESTPSSNPQKKQPKKTNSLLDSDQPQPQQPPQSPQSPTKPTQQFDFFAEQKKQATISSISPSQEHLSNILNPPSTIGGNSNREDFNTMQNMFATVNVSGGTGYQVNQGLKQDGSLDLLDSSTGTLGQAVNLNANHVNPSDFNTMQRMFATNQNQMMFLNPTMSTNSVPVSVGGSQFNTMQNLFATGMPTQFPNPITLQQPPTQTPQLTNPQIPTSGDFYTIGNLFATGQGINLPPPTTTTPKTADFNTMQNLFATSGLPSQNLNEFNQPVTNTNTNTNIQNVKLEDFNTMQNLFKTGSGIMLPPPTQNVQPSTVKAEDDPFNILGINQTTPKVQIKTTTSTVASSPSASMFNTYSGSKSSTSPTIDISAFGTMQKGQTNNIDFFQNLNQPQPQQQQVPNFSKKKPAAQQDLI